MQFKKDYLEKKLLEAGEEEFFVNGFQGASVRKIAALAGTTLGNFYNYFKNKEDMFNQVVKDEIEKFNGFINGHQDEDEMQWLLVDKQPHEWFEYLKEFSNLFNEIFTRKFYILVACSKGTKHESSKKMILHYIKEHFIEHAMESNKEIPELEKTAQMLASGFLDGILYIIKNHSDEQIVKILLKNHMMFFFMGTLGVIKGCRQESNND